jgi:ATP/maltotriose-dependent transcriptional regulator MalT
LAGGAVAGGYVLRTHDEPRPAPSSLTTDQSVAWLASAIERGQLDNASEKYEMAGTLAQQAGDPVHASIARSTGALVLALRGHLAAARAHLAEADATKGKDPVALAYADMASAAIGVAAGELDVALRASSRCASAFAPVIPELAAMCYELRGTAATARGDVAIARAALEQGLAIVGRIESAPRETTLRLALAALDLDAGQYDQVVTDVTARQAEAAARGAVGPEAHAWILLSRAHIALAATQQALEDLGHVRADSLEPFQARIEHGIALGEVDALLGDPDEGWRLLGAARGEAQREGFPGLVLAARLARVEVLIATSAADASAEQQALIADARGHGYGRIAHLAETAGQR